MVFQCVNIRQVPLELLKTAAFGHGTWRMLMHGKTCLIPIIFCLFTIGAPRKGPILLPEERICSFLEESLSIKSSPYLGKNDPKH